MLKTATLLFCIFLFGPIKGQDSLKGEWISKINKKYSIVIGDSTWTDKYKDKIIGTHYYYIINDTLFNFNKRGNTPFKYEILSVSKEYFILLELWRGRRLTFRRK